MLREYSGTTALQVRRVHANRCAQGDQNRGAPRRLTPRKPRKGSGARPRDLRGTPRGHGSGIQRRRNTRPEARGLLDTADEVFETAELVVKVKEPLGVERARLRSHTPCSLTCISPPTPSRPTICSTAGPRHRIRVGDGPRGPATAAGAHVAGGGEDVCAGRGSMSRSLRRWTRRAAGWHSRRGRGAGCCDRRRCRRPQRGGDGGSASAPM